MRTTKELLAGLVLSASLWTTACGVELTGEEAELEAAPAALSAGKAGGDTMNPLANPPWIRNFSDASGMVWIRIKECDWTLSVPHPSTSCSVDPGFVLVGGGAEIDGEGSPGALLTESMPSADLTTWFASSKDHVQSYSHRLRAYAIGLSLVGVSEATLRSHMTYVQASGTGSAPTAFAMLPTGYTLLGGGGRTQSYGAGQLLVDSYPSGYNMWAARSKDHLISDPGAVTAYAIGITSSGIPGFGTLDIINSSAVVTSLSGYSAASLSTPPGWVTTSIGADVDYAGAGRMLTDLVPYLDPPNNVVHGARARSKDHLVASTGFTRAHVIYISKQ